MNLLLALVPTVLAAPAGDEIRDALDRPVPPTLVLACAPLSALRDALGPALAKAPIPKDTPPQGRVFLDLLAPGAMEQAGIDPAGALVVSAQAQDKNGFTARIPFTGTSDQARALLTTMAPEAPQSEGATQWVLATGKVDVDVVWAPTTLTLSALGDMDGAPKSRSWAGVMEGMGEAPGCLLYVALPKEKKAPALAVSMPADGGSMRMHVLSAEPLPALGAGQPPSPDLASDPRPLAVVHLGSDPLKLLGEPAFSKLAGAIQEQVALKDIGDHLSFPAGISMGLFSMSKPFRWAAVVPVADGRGRKLRTRRIHKGLDAMGEGLEWTSRTTFHDDDAKLPMSGRIDRGRVLLASDETLLASVARGGGEPWFSDDAVGRAAQWPLTIIVRVPSALTGGGPEISMDLGLRTVGELLQLEVTTHSGNETVSGAFIMGILAAVAIPNYVRYTQKAREAEVTQNLESIWTAEHVYYAEHDQFLATTVAPRPLDTIDKTAVPWAEDGTWGPLEWVPSGDQRGVYEVEVRADGQQILVHGWIDADGDGEPKHFVRDAEGRREVP